MRRFACLLLTAAVAGWAWGPAPARSSQGDSRDLAVEGVEEAESPGREEESRSGGRSPFGLVVDVDRPDRVYELGEEVLVHVTSERRGHLYLVHRGASGRVYCLFPNKYQTVNPIPADKRVVVPAPDARFLLRVKPPLGTETIRAIVSLEEIPLERFGVRSLTDRAATPISEKAIKDIGVELRETPATFAERTITVRTVRRRGVERPREIARPRRPRRVALLVGISQYLDERIEPLTVCHKDALKMAEVLKRYGRVDEVITLVDRQATLANIRTAICRTLVEKTRPGDEILLYWSGHGARLGDDGSDEPDGQDEYLAPYDGRFDDFDSIRRTMLIDDTFGRWLAALPGRRIALILDSCHSGGQATDEKGGEKSLAAPRPNAPFDFLDRPKSKDVDDRTAVLLCSAMARQKGFERLEGDLSTMTYYLVRLLESADGPISLTDAYRGVRDEVRTYVEATFGVDQTPVLIPGEPQGQRIYLRP